MTEIVHIDPSAIVAPTPTPAFPEPDEFPLIWRVPYKGPANTNASWLYFRRGENSPEMEFQLCETHKQCLAIIPVDEAERQTLRKLDLLRDLS